MLANRQAKMDDKVGALYYVPVFKLYRDLN